ncbi:MAG: hypothetical protein UT11_C0008G0003 [Berkelbacteria bacterium GW2011_GWA2_38_9]|uniref:Uncharacterized protein n=1 Tax=Berkelbacteria bacterium GW2011_GWA2_38_9 TaxID=1618334 RepID=A0A0G0LQR0_9BACT|nr:MAG: hypothetical protein UT11_C0008G0003 [Berkelbacteria bacterium GW2011_GWA2_38_9]
MYLFHIYYNLVKNIALVQLNYLTVILNDKDFGEKISKLRPIRHFLDRLHAHHRSLEKLRKARQSLKQS